jgi:hypothetical protein
MKKIDYFTESIRLTTETIQAHFDELSEQEQKQFLNSLKGVHQNILHLYTQIITNHIKTA